MKKYEGMRTIDGIVVTVDDTPLDERFDIAVFDDKGFECTNQTLDGCVLAAAEACDTLAGCSSFSVISKFFNGRVWAELGPRNLSTGEANQWWYSWAKPTPTPGKWKPATSSAVHT